MSDSSNPNVPLTIQACKLGTGGTDMTSNTHLLRFCEDEKNKACTVRVQLSMEEPSNSCGSYDGL